MSERRFGALLSLVRQGVTLGLDYGTHSLEVMLSVAETVEEAVLEPGSFVRTPGGLGFALANPPLRTGAFSSIRARVAGRAVPPEHVRLRGGAGEAWRRAADLSRTAPWTRGPGERTEFEIDLPSSPAGETTVRLEFECPAIPPLVWLEFTETPGERLP